MDDKKIFEAISTPELLAEVERRVQTEGLVLPESLVGAAATASELDEPSLDQTMLKNKVEGFIDPDSDMDLDEQLGVMAEFWQNLGMNSPELSDEQKASIADTMEKNPGKRVVPTPLLDLKGRQDIATLARGLFPANKFNVSRDPLWVPDETRRYGRLLRDPDGKVKEDRTIYGLGYKLPNGEQAVGRTHFIDAMADSGQAVAGDDGTVWVYPVIDVSVDRPRSKDKTVDLYEAVDPTVTPDTVIALQLLHQVNGTPHFRPDVDFANEAIFVLSTRGNPKSLARVAGVYWSSERRVLDLDDWDPADRNGRRFGVRAAESGLTKS
ncbi:MAG TPA: hypothetical protein VFW77_03965 [Candidatus Saccharimonadales bacterium]|nr:hypothetical protein [Candidatus Saccharimonadales bacterium]